MCYSIYTLIGTDKPMTWISKVARIFAPNRAQCPIRERTARRTDLSLSLGSLASSQRACKKSHIPRENLGYARCARVRSTGNARVCVCVRAAHVSTRVTVVIMTAM